MSIIPTLFLKKSFSEKFELNIKKEKLASLTDCSRMLDEILNRKPNKSLAYVGASAFSHKGGLHVSAVQKCRGTSPPGHPTGTRPPRGRTPGRTRWCGRRRPAWG